MIGLEMLASFLKIDPAQMAKIKAEIDAFDIKQAKAGALAFIARAIAAEKALHELTTRLEAIELQIAFGAQANAGGSFMHPNTVNHLNNALLDEEFRPARLTDGDEDFFKRLEAENQLALDLQAEQKTEGTENDNGSDNAGTDAASGSDGDARPN